MRNKFWSLWILTLLFTALIRFAVFAVQAGSQGLTLQSPPSCPATGCAAGQRLNFTVDFSVDPQFSSGGANTQICIYTPSDGLSGTAVSPWADFSLGWITDDALYDQGQVGSLCSDETPTGDAFLTGVHAKHSDPIKDQIEFALHIHPETNLDGHVHAKVFQLDSTGTNWTETSSPSDAFTKDISVTPLATTAYTAEFTADCGSHKPCLVHSGDDHPNGQGTGLYDAIQALDPGGKILILKDYRIKTYPIKVDKRLTIQGFDEESMLTSINSSQACSNSLIQFESGGVLQNLQINDGNCSASNSRTLVEINSSEGVSVLSSTLTFGDVAVHVRDNTGSVDIAFNEIANNLDYAVLVDAGSSDPGRVNIYANNILNNGTTIQANCNAGGIANHNFWGEGALGSANVTDCITSNGKDLGAPILAASDGRGVQALLSTVKSSFSYHFDGQIGVRHTAGGDFNLVIVNHGQGNPDNIPFYASGSGDINPCGNFYDLFLAKDASPKNLELALKYDLNDQCLNIIESEYYCGNASQSRYPLWWYDPAMDVTEGWDRTGQPPKGAGGGGASGQTTDCDTVRDEIIVEIDNAGRPGLFSDLNFTPFITGYIDGAPLTDFSAAFTNFYTRITWTTAKEKNIQRYELLKSEKETSGYEIVTTVNVSTDSSTPNTYQYYDYDVNLGAAYYYKLRVFHRSEPDEIIGNHGPISLNVPDPTVTITPSVTNTPTITRTNVPTSTPVYRTPTRPIYRSPTPAGTPTQVRTYGPSPTGGTKPAFEPSPTGTLTPFDDPNSGYPAGDETATSQTQDPGSDQPTPTPSRTAAGSQGTETLPGTETANNGTGGDQTHAEANPPVPRAFHLMVGLGTGLALLLGASVIMAKTVFR